MLYCIELRIPRPSVGVVTICVARSYNLHVLIAKLKYDNIFPIPLQHIATQGLNHSVENDNRMPQSDKQKLERTHDMTENITSTSDHCAYNAASNTWYAVWAAVQSDSIERNSLVFTFSLLLYSRTIAYDTYLVHILRRYIVPGIYHTCIIVYTLQSEYEHELSKVTFWVWGLRSLPAQISP